MARHLQVISSNKNKLVKKLSLQEYVSIYNAAILTLIALKLFGVL